MANTELIREWVDFADMDYRTAKHLYAHMYPKPLEIICYHCQQAIEKLLKALLLAQGIELKRTHDLGLLAELLTDHYEIDECYLEMCDNLTPYGVKIRYPQELYIEERHVDKAMGETEILYQWLSSVIESELCKGGPT